MSELSRREAAAILWNRGILKWKLDLNQQQLYDAYKTSKSKLLVWLASRRLGKCLPEGTEILTPSGPIAIEKLKKGDMVYGYNEDGTISPTTVVQLFDQGEKEVVDLLSSGRKIGASTLDHKWLVHSDYDNNYHEKRLADFSSRHKIARRFVEIPGGIVNEPHAYAIGALLGDGCSKQGRKKIHISSEDVQVPTKVAKILNCLFYRQSEQNYTWVISKDEKKPQGYSTLNNKQVECNYYTEWCKDRYAHEKIIDIEVIKTWNRVSRLELLAGLLDTDGSIGVNSNILTIQFCSQSLSIMEAVQYLIYSLFQYKVKILKDNRESKYKNGPLHQLSFRNNLFCKKALRELSPHLAKDKKKWVEQYNDLLENNSNPNYVGVNKSAPYKAKCFDIEVDNKTHLYLTAEGLVTHNSHTLCVLALEACIKEPNVTVKYVAPQTKMVRSIIRPLLRDILKDCPPELKPEYKTQEQLWRFPNGSEIQLAGTDNQNAENIRGGGAVLCIVDEAGFCSDLDYIIKSILLPTTTTTRGKIILSSTPSRLPAHEFNDYIKDAESRGSLIKKTIYDNPRLTLQDIEDMKREYGGEDSIEWRREFLCQVVRDEELTVIPEFNESLQTRIISDWIKPAHYDSYVSMDVGGRDLHAVLFAYLDFRAGKLIIEDELVFGGQFTTSDLVSQIELKERILWNKKPYLRVADNNNIILLNDLQIQHKMTFIPTAKDNADAALQNMRTLLKQEKILINPKCTTLIRHLKNAKWNNNHTSYARTKEDGHFDMLDAIKYLCRNVQFFKNPYPNNYDTGPNSIFFNGKQEESKYSKFKDLFKTKKSISG